LSAELTKTHSFRLLFRRFCPLGTMKNYYTTLKNNWYNQFLEIYVIYDTISISTINPFAAKPLFQRWWIFHLIIGISANNRLFCAYIYNIFLLWIIKIAHCFVLFSLDICSTHTLLQDFPPFKRSHKNVYFRFSDNFYTIFQVSSFGITY